MFTVLDFFFKDHDFLYVGLAAAVCMLSAYACVSLLRHAMGMKGRTRTIWLTVSALSVGLGIWSTHFVAMLAFRAGFPLQYDFVLTGVSLLIAIAVCGAGLAVAVRASALQDRFLGGALVGAGISAMHYVGIAALMLEGRPVWSDGLVAISIIAGIILSGLAVVTAMGGGRVRLVGGAVLLTLAICAMHFTAMSAADFSNCLPLIHSGLNIDWQMMSLIVTGITLLILTAVLGSIVLDEADRRRTAREAAREQADADRIASVTQKLELALTHMGQAIALYSAEGRILLHNARMLEMLGLPAGTSAVGMSVEELAMMSFGYNPSSGLDRSDIERIAREHVAMAQRGGEIVSSISDRFMRVKHNPIGDGRWVTMMEDISESKRNEAAIAHMALHDTLTGLPNRAQFDQLFERALSEAAEKSQHVGVVAMDLDRFKEINDSYGHATGDQVLRVLAERFHAVLKPGEMVARLGGDEFAAFKPFATIEALREFLERIEKVLFGTVQHNEILIATAGSIGVATYPDDGKDPSKLLSNADLAMYRAKADFDAHICYYEAAMDENARRRRAMVKDLWTALEQDGFELAYQVQKSIASNEITGYEVLLRWNRPGHGWVSPADFIPVAEECGAINAIGAWVLRTACQEAAGWPTKHKIAVNVSGVQLTQIELVDLVQMVLYQSGLAPERLELEVTETAIISDKKRALTTLLQIREMGVSIAIDDFGTGYSSLETLRSFPFDKIKLDRSFMQEVENSEQSKAIVRAILALGRSLSVPVLAEGVETIEQLNVLRHEGCNEAQGYFLGRPGRMSWDQTVSERALA